MKTSFLVPTYNRAYMLPRCLDSILAQTDEDWEIVIIDGASTDGTLELIMDQYLNRSDSHIRYIRQGTNEGIISAFAQCVDEARGKYAKFVFTDDTIEPTFLEKTLPLLEDPNIGFVWTKTGIGPSPDQITEHYRWADEITIIPSDVYLEAALTGWVPPVSPGCAIFRARDAKRNMMRRWSPQWLGAGPDLLLMLFTAVDYLYVGYHPERLSYFCAHPGSISIANNPTVLQGYEVARRLFRELI